MCAPFYRYLPSLMMSATMRCASAAMVFDGSSRWLESALLMAAGIGPLSVARSMVEGPDIIRHRCGHVNICRPFVIDQSTNLSTLYSPITCESVEPNRGEDFTFAKWGLNALDRTYADVSFEAISVSFASWRLFEAARLALRAASADACSAAVPRWKAVE
jgi:hypothetical protein